MRQGATWLIVVVLASTALLVWHFAATDDWKKRGLYLWRTRKPHAFLGLPIIGRHNAYVGMTGSRYHRDLQHRFGTATAPPASWSDLSPQVRALPCLFPGWEFARRVQEKLWILVLLPVYNDKWNHANPRRITVKYARTLRERRQAGGRRFNLSLALVRAPLTFGAFYLIWIGGQHWVN